jgi:hypothetical protein
MTASKTKSEAAPPTPKEQVNGKSNTSGSMGAKEAKSKATPEPEDDPALAVPKNICPAHRIVWLQTFAHGIPHYAVRTSLSDSITKCYDCQRRPQPAPQPVAEEPCEFCLQTTANHHKNCKFKVRTISMAAAGDL